MRNGLMKTLKTGLSIALPVLALAATPAAGATAKKQAAVHPATTAAAKPPAPVPAPSGGKAEPKEAVASHSTSGVVTSVSESRLVITRKTQNKPVSMAFTLGPSTEREGKLEVGSKVSVRYRNEGSAHVATAVMAQPAKGNSKDRS